MQEVKNNRIPNGWELSTVSKVAKISTGSRNTQDNIPNGDYPFFVRSQTVERINSWSFDGEAVLTAGDGVGTGKVFHYINGKFDFHQRVYKISDFSSNVKGYFFYLYFKENFYNRIMQMTAKSSVDSVRMEMIANMEFPIPPIKEQTAIATALSDMDALISNLEKLIEKKRMIKQGVMQELLKPKNGWQPLRICDIAEVIGGSTPKTNIPEYWHGNINWFTPTEIGLSKYVADSERKISYAGLASCSARLLPVGTILLTSRAGIGDLGILTNVACTNQGFQSLVMKEGFSNEFVYYLMSTLKPVLFQYASGSTFLEISPNKLRNINVMMPNFSEQVQIAKILGYIDNDIDSADALLRKYIMIKQGMMQALLTGKIRLI